MIKALHKWRGTFVMSSFQRKLAYSIHILTTLRMCVKKIKKKVATFFLIFYGRH